MKTIIAAPPAAGGLKIYLGNSVKIYLKYSISFEQIIVFKAKLEFKAKLCSFSKRSWSSKRSFARFHAKHSEEVYNLTKPNKASL
jgi:hypothetical protein